MPFVFAALAGFIIGGGVVGYILSQRWKAQVQEAEQALKPQKEALTCSNKAWRNGPTALPSEG